MMLVFCEGMPRSASTLLFNLTREVMEASGGIAATRTHGKMPVGRVRELVATRERMLFKGHTLTPGIVGMLSNPGVRVLYCWRDIRDVAASLRHFNGLTGEGLAKRLGECLDEQRTAFGLAYDGNIRLFTYDALVTNPSGSVGRIARHLDVVMDVRQAAEIADAWSLDAVEGMIADASGDPVPPSGHVDKVTQLHANHISPTRGAPGAWRSLTGDDLQIATTAYEQQCEIVGV